MKDARIPITNSLAERAIKPFAVHRKNWLFADSVAGAKANAIMYSFIESIITTRKRVVCSSPRRGFTCSPPKGGIEYLTLHYYYCCHLPVALSTYFSFLNGSIYSSIPI